MNRSMNGKNARTLSPRIVKNAVESTYLPPRGKRMRRHHRSSLLRRTQRAWQSVSYRRRRLLFKIFVGLLSSTLAVLFAWLIVLIFS